MVDYKQKYIKYKQKYLLTKQIIEGGEGEIIKAGFSYVDAVTELKATTEFNSNEIKQLLELKDKTNFTLEKIEKLWDNNKTVGENVTQITTAVNNTTVKQLENRIASLPLTNKESFEDAQNFWKKTNEILELKEDNMFKDGTVEELINQTRYTKEEILDFWNDKVNVEQNATEIMKQAQKDGKLKNIL